MYRHFELHDVHLTTLMQSPFELIPGAVTSMQILMHITIWLIMGFIFEIFKSHFTLTHRAQSYSDTDKASEGIWPVSCSFIDFSFYVFNYPVSGIF